MAAILISTILVAAGLFAIDDTSAKKRHHKRIKVGALISLAGNPAFSGTVVARRRCQRNRYIQIRRASNGVLIGTAESNAAGAFSQPSSFGGHAYAVATSRPMGRRVKCRAASSSPTAIGAADLELAKAAAGTVAGSPRYEITVTNLGPSSAEDIVITDSPRAVPATGDFDLEGAESSPGCSLATGMITCSAGLLGPGKSFTRTIVLSCGAGTVSFFNSASVVSTAPDPAAANNTVSDVPSAPC